MKLATETRETPLRPTGQPLEHGSLVIADLHLNPVGDARVDAFVEWIAVSRAPRLLILGDLFDVWVGPSQARMGGAASVIAGLSTWTARGAALDIVPGNRDFLLGDFFTELTGARLWHDGFVAEAPGSGDRILFLHGDELCTKDLAYQRMKRILRSSPMRRLARHMPLPLARWAAGRLRRASVQAVARKPLPEKTMQESACRAFAQGAGAQVVVCGHAHEFQDRRLDGGPRWVVLDAWGGDRDVLAIERDGSLVAERGGYGHGGE